MILFSISIHLNLIKSEKEGLKTIGDDNGIIQNEGYEEDSPLPFASLITPFVYEDNVTTVNEAYSDTKNCPWGFVHQGIDFFTFNNSPFQAVADCVLTEKIKFYNSGNGQWQVNLRLEYSSDVWFGMAFEPGSANESHGDQQLTMISHSEGTQLKKGDIIGTLLTVRDGAHVDWGVRIYDINVCPAPYFTPEAYQSVLNTIQKNNPSWEMCYCNCSPIFLTKTNTITIADTITVVKSSWSLIFLPILAVICILMQRKRKK